MAAPDATTMLVLNTLLGLVIAGVGWWVKNMWTMVVEMQKQITLLQVELGKNYVPRAELQESFKQIFSKMDELLKAQAALTAAIRHHERV